MEPAAREFEFATCGGDEKTREIDEDDVLRLQRANAVEYQRKSRARRPEEARSAAADTLLLPLVVDDLVDAHLIGEIVQLLEGYILAELRVIPGSVQKMLLWSVFLEDRQFDHTCLRIIYHPKMLEYKKKSCSLFAGNWT